MVDFILLTIGGCFIGIFSVVIGGGMFFTVPLFQILFPNITFGSIVGNQKVGSFFRGIGSTLATRHHIDYKTNLIILIPLHYIHF